MPSSSLLHQLLKYDIYQVNLVSGAKYGIKVSVNSDYLLDFYFKNKSTAEELVKILNSNTIDINQAPYIIQDYIWDKLRKLTSQSGCIEL
ncbi:MAG: hypothetical protein J6L81_10485 [Clostridia bacterium]|nr:hypothetical protein [Clostridia bacterium]